VWVFTTFLTGPTFCDGRENCKGVYGNRKSFFGRVTELRNSQPACRKTPLRLRLSQVLCVTWSLLPIAGSDYKDITLTHGEVCHILNANSVLISTRFKSQLSNQSRRRMRKPQLTFNKTRNIRINVTLRRLRKNILALENKRYFIFWVCVCSLSYPSIQSARVTLYCHPWPVRLYHIFSHFLINGTIVEESYWTQNVCFGNQSTHFMFFLTRFLF
jgi:hypothetical protein